MSFFDHQALISSEMAPTWAKEFSSNEFLYLKHVINGLINNSGGFEDFLIEVDGNSKTLHIYEPFTSLNFLGYLSPSVVSIKFISEKTVKFLTGDDNGIGIHSSRLQESEEIKLPNNLTDNICLWHFIDSIGNAYPDHYE
ncbi:MULTISPECIES: hypothetical protein [unclassified Acinetobacter]|uniref:hypothetical protein n=1 Tax=unclassified Acinetobacter TaxID=196816 RepID=UPI00244A78ED|nr:MULTISPECIES: hypothetical protein [unclassified Acinetobacter]MDH0032925.1 hypothetical protein [Acinetobacter sp. GD04021]MDH0887320.1 hypothetical protein [Acinetobacter sp. GD03873]MDH1084716.1 hypothetical protein [Acinetobacter sp. GD03983]MDH2190636.1 hypothetical protein [Acinetobacter sp. GD03645]MDH2205070.1 hypothetical protein [Acinetobacter sp. GD03647]